VIRVDTGVDHRNHRVAGGRRRAIDGDDGLGPDVGPDVGDGRERDAERSSRGERDKSVHVRS
jgi:hypothetical protein